MNDDPASDRPPNRTDPSYHDQWITPPDQANPALLDTLGPGARLRRQDPRANAAGRVLAAFLVAGVLAVLLVGCWHVYGMAVYYTCLAHLVNCGGG